MSARHARRFRPILHPRGGEKPPRELRARRVGSLSGAAMGEIFRRDLETAEEILLPAWRRRPIPHRLGDRMARWLSPAL